jgi:hypothetical protein
MITPAISVLSAVEGLKVVDPGLAELVVPITVAIIIGLFAVQRHGTATMGRFFGPVMILWFVVIGFSGVRGIMGHPQILRLSGPDLLWLLVGHFALVPTAALVGNQENFLDFVAFDQKIRSVPSGFPLYKAGRVQVEKARSPRDGQHIQPPVALRSQQLLYCTGKTPIRAVDCKGFGMDRIKGDFGGKRRHERIVSTDVVDPPRLCDGNDE